MACAKGCSGTCTATCANSCSVACTGGCQKDGCTGCAGCRGGCRDTGGCGGDCQGSCSGCRGTCQGCTSCSGCSGTCSGGCGSSCSSSCSSACAATCADNCTGGCTSSCTGTCASKCTGGAQDTNAANLNLTTKFEKANIQAISDFIVTEAKRKSQSPTSISFSVGEKISKSKIDTIIANLKKAGKTASYSATVGSKGLKVLGEDLITKALDAWDDAIALP